MNSSSMASCPLAALPQTCWRVPRTLMLLFALTLILAACGGGGGGGGNNGGNSGGAGGGGGGGAVAPSITQQPWTSSAKVGSSATLYVLASGSGSLSYQWQVSMDGGSTWHNVTDGTGGTTVSYTTPTTTAAMNVWQYRVAVTNSYGTTNSNGVSPGVLSATLKLPHTGVTSSQCYKAGTDTLQDCAATGASTAQALNNQQDGMRTTVNPMSYSLVAKAGGGFYDTTECVKDNVTGLVWEGKTAGTYDGTTTPPTHLRAGSRSFTNYDSSAAGSHQLDPANDVTAAEVAAAANSLGYVAAVNALSLCGFSDWRLPTVDELSSIVKFSAATPSIDSTWFPNTQSCPTWAASPVVGHTDKAWYVDFLYGDVSFDSRFGGGSHNNNAVRLVRASH